jgi:hypothetical protein
VKHLIQYMIYGVGFSRNSTLTLTLSLLGQGEGKRGVNWIDAKGLGRRVFSSAAPGTKARRIARSAVSEINFRNH